MRIAAALTLGALLAGPPEAATPTQVVRIDVVASDARGRPLETLKPSDFELRDDGVVRPLDAVRLIKPSPDESRLIAIFLDEYHVSAGATDRVRSAVAAFIQTELRPSDQLVVMKPLDSLFAIKLTTDREPALAAVAEFTGRKGDYDARNAYERNFMAGVPSRIEAARTQIALSAVNALAVHFSTVPDQRKTLIVVTEGLGRVERHRGMEYLPTLETIRRSADRSNVAIYTVNPGDAVGQDADGLAAVAAATSGRAADQDLEAALRVASTDASGYYLLTYRASRAEDGRFHPVDVSVKRAGAQLRARRGYYAPSPDEALRKTLLAKIENPPPPPPLEPAAHASVLIRPWIGTARGAAGRTRITIVWEPAPRLATDRLKRSPSQVKLTALAPDDSVLFEGGVLPTGAGAIDEGVGPPSRAVFEMKPGRLRLRMAILDAAGNVLDTDVRSIAIRDMQSGVTIATPEVLRARNAREFRALDSAQAVPVSAREFSRTERLFIRINAYGPSGAEVAVRARLLSRMGPMRDLAVSDDQSIAGARVLDVPLAGLATGEYIIEVEASGAAGEAKDVIDFRVTT